MPDGCRGVSLRAAVRDSWRPTIPDLPPAWRAARSPAVLPASYGRPCHSGDVSLMVARVKYSSPGLLVTGWLRQKVTSTG